MKLSKKTYYGFRCLLAISQETNPVSGHDLALREEMPEEYIEKILQELRRCGFVESHKGTTGGYTLSKNPSEINAWDVVRTLDGPLKIYSPSTEHALPCFQVSHCQANKMIIMLERDIERSLKEISLASLTHSELVC